MDKSSLTVSFRKLAAAGESAGFTLENMIQLLNTGLTVEDLLDLIGTRLNRIPVQTQPLQSGRWVM